MNARQSSGAHKPSAVFLDRDGTVIQEVGERRSLDEMALVPDAANAIRYINYAIVPIVLVTNEPGIGQGHATEEQVAAVNAQLDDLLAERNASIEAKYHCAHDPVAGSCECRKPGTALFRRAINDLGVDASRCAYIGDRLEDIAPARTLGGRGILVPSPATPAAEIETAGREMEIAATLTDAVHALFDPPPPAALG